MQTDILILLSPIVEMANPILPLEWYRSFVPRLLSSVEKLDLSPRFTIVCSEFFLEHIRRSGLPVHGRIVTIKQRDLLDRFSFNALVESVHHQRASGGDAFFHHVGAVIVDSLGREYDPSIVFSFTPAPFVREQFPRALLFHHEFGLLSRPPYPETFLFDPCGLGMRSFASEHSGELNMLPVSDEEREAWGKYREQIASILNISGPIGEFLHGLRMRFDHILLLPLGYENFYVSSGAMPYQSQFELAEHVLDSLDGSTAVILTQHPFYKALQQSSIEKLKEHYPNLFNEPWFNAVPNISQFFVAASDGCVTQSSSVGLQAAMLGKYFVSCAGFFDGLTDCNRIDDISRLFHKPPIDRTPFFTWVAKHYNVSEDAIPEFLHDAIESGFGGGGCVPSALSWPSRHENFAAILERYAKSYAIPFVNQVRELERKSINQLNSELEKDSLIDKLNNDISSLWKNNIRLEREIARLLKSWEEADVAAKHHLKAWEGADAEAKRRQSEVARLQEENERLRAGYCKGIAAARRLCSMSLFRIAKEHLMYLLSKVFHRNRR